MKKYDKQFDIAYQRLNDKQRQAVEQIYGPVMTIAGPGTGKTQLLAVRIGHIIKETDTDIRNVLALTYTDAGSHEMRERLRKFIGPDAYNANIYTYHSFCNEVIRSNPESFGGLRELNQVSDLELVDIFQELIDSWPANHPLKRFKGNLYGELPRLRSLFSTMKKESWTPEKIHDAVEGLGAYFRNSESPDYAKWHYTKKYTSRTTGVKYEAGDFKSEAFTKEKAKFDNLLAATKELSLYNDILRRKNRYDYDDMIQWVIKAFQTDKDLLLDYQERYQFILVDEYQDTNGSQNELLFLLSDNEIDDKPNIFIVGDDDQAIFRFQGANMNNIIDFANKYNPTKIVLSNNYRSYQGILDQSKKLIEFNNHRLVNEDDTLQKELIESRPKENTKGAEPYFYQYENETQEEWGLISQINNLKANGIAYKDIAVIYRSHKNVDNIIKYFSQKGVPLNIKRKLDALQQKDTKRLVNILRYLDKEYQTPYAGDTRAIYEMMHYDYFEIKSRDAGLVSLYCSNKTDNLEDDKRWRTVIANDQQLKKAEVENIESIIGLSYKLERWIEAIPNTTVQVLFEQILTEGNILDDILRSEDQSWRLQVVNTFFNLIKTEADKNDKFSLKELIQTLDKMEENNLTLPLTKFTSSEEGINFMTAHGSKGLEFDHVFIIRAHQANWVKKMNYLTKFRFPQTMVPISDKSDVEDDRRLFYVAMTRARDFLHISYPLQTDDDKPQSAATFVTEITDVENIETEKVGNNEILAYKAELMRYQKGEIEMIDHDLISRVLKTFKMSSTSLNKYLKCPTTFYFENILRIPMARTAPMGYGNAIHYALEQYFKALETNSERKLPELEKLKQFFRDGMRKYHSHFTLKEAELLVERGAVVMEEYYEAYWQTWSIPRKFEMEYHIETEYDGVPITGNIDRVNIYDDHVAVTDYKTGKYKAPSLKPAMDEEIGGDYWRQIIFYKMLMDGDRQYAGRMKKGTMSYVEKDKASGKHKEREFEVAGFEVQTVAEQLKTSFNAINEHKFEQGCEDEKCNWCNFVKENAPVQLSEMNEDNPEV